jgi:hypothetical protein
VVCIVRQADDSSCALLQKQRQHVVLHSTHVARWQ